MKRYIAEGTETGTAFWIVDAMQDKEVGLLDRTTRDAINMVIDALNHDDAQRETITRLEGEVKRYELGEVVVANRIRELQARLTASESAKKWTRERPTVAGWYWWRKGPGYSKDMTAVSYDENQSEWKAKFLGLKGSISTLPVDVCDGEWQGPLTPEKEKEKGGI